MRRARTWFTHYVFGEHARDGLPFGSTLGGYGARHRLRWSAWSPSPRWTVSAEEAAGVRGGGNLLAGRWPGKRRGISVPAAYRPSGSIRFEVASGIAGGPEFPTAAMLELTGTVSSGRGRE